MDNWCTSCSYKECEPNWGAKPVGTIMHGPIEIASGEYLGTFCDVCFQSLATNSYVVTE